jgi:hypothetical protein
MPEFLNPEQVPKMTVRMKILKVNAFEKQRKID